MELERVRPTVLRATLHAYELAALVTAARYVVDASPAEVPDAARDQLRGLLAKYDTEIHRLATVPATPDSAEGATRP